MINRAMLAAAAVLVAVALASASNAQLSDTFTNWIDHPAIDYRSTPPTDAVAELNRRIQEGSVQLELDGTSGYLRSVLAALNVPVESQIAVFAQDSFQRNRIGLQNPRTLFFNDSVAVGWVRGGFIELAAQDARQGVTFYALDPAGPGRPQLVRRDDCLSCHYSYATAGVPGMLVRSAGEFTVDHTLPFEKRWGGWYVTGSHGSIRHLGNADLNTLFAGPPSINSQNWPSLDGKFDTSGYVSAHSDIVALMVFEHQMHLMNLLTRVGWEARVADYQARNRGTGPASEKDEDAPVSLADAASEIVDYLLFINEAPLTDTIRGSSSFVVRFEAQGPRDSKGRTLRQLDLRSRLLRYRCSYMVYAPVFTQLPQEARDAIYRRMWQVLSGDDRDAKYERLSRSDRLAVVEILRETKEDLPDYFLTSLVH